VRAWLLWVSSEKRQSIAFLRTTFFQLLAYRIYDRDQNGTMSFEGTSWMWLAYLYIHLSITHRELAVVLCFGMLNS
jgi:hypothetical protein